MLVYTEIYNNTIINQTSNLMKLIADFEIEDINAIIAKFQQHDEGEKGFICSVYPCAYSRIECWRI